MRFIEVYDCESCPYFLAPYWCREFKLFLEDTSRFPEKCYLWDPTFRPDDIKSYLGEFFIEKFDEGVIIHYGRDNTSPGLAYYEVFPWALGYVQGREEALREKAMESKDPVQVPPQEEE